MIEQTISTWDGWPDDVRDRLRDWNDLYLLSFRRRASSVTAGFFCGGCRRLVAFHPNGDAVVRPHRKAKGTRRCEDCLIEMARQYAEPFGGRRLLLTVEGRLRARIAALENKRLRLREQIANDQVYIDELEDQIPPDIIQAIRDRLRGRLRRP